MPLHYIPLHTLRTACRYAKQRLRPWQSRACVISSPTCANHGVVIFL